MMRDSASLFSWLTRLRAKSEAMELKAQVRSFCAFASKCPFLSRFECSKCLDYYLHVESTRRIFAR